MGIAENKFLAKVASDLRKPCGLVVVPPGTAAEFLGPLPVERLWGVGPRTAEALHGIGLRRIGDVAETPEEKLQALLGADLAGHLWKLSQGIDDRPIKAHFEARSVGRETTFAEFLSPSDRDGIEGISSPWPTTWPSGSRGCALVPDGPAQGAGRQVPDVHAIANPPRAHAGRRGHCTARPGRSSRSAYDSDVSG